MAGDKHKPTTNLCPLAQLLKTMKYSDFKIKCQGEEFPVHKAIVCTQSPVIAAAVDGGFRESLTASFNIEDFDAETVRLTIEFMYTQKYSTIRQPAVDEAPESESKSMANPEFGPGAEPESSPESPSTDDASRTAPATPMNDDPDSSANSESHKDILVQHVHMNGIGDYLAILGLQERANRHIAHILETKWSTSGFMNALTEVFSLDGDTALLELMATNAALHIDELVEEDIYDALDIPPTFSKLLVKNLAARQLSLAQENRLLGELSRKTDKSGCRQMEAILNAV
ncbi:hypothetical protein AJ80_05851 [Polytolypa hystricis UAMH7299]|uniref:BTB domain-containing protein n=1 Tax=Polytolypa hystricis (strain UAMH7299) TaxID=1447883 RepID=A0A2B7Y065_POLH7|nr:hypothetical protein AJ80_05851 [Polytolypa hystricis UAMH7299]